MRKTDTRTDTLITVAAALGSIVLLNVLAIDHYARVDLTKDGVFTLSQATIDTLADLEDQVTISAYFTSDLPPPFSSNARFVKDLLSEYRVRSGGLVSFEFVDPEEDESQEDKAIKKEVKRDIFGRRIREKTSVETELEALGIQSVEIRVIEEDQAQTKRAYMGIVVRYGEQTEVVPVVQNIATVEYDITSLIKRLTRARTPVLGVLQGHGEPSLQEDLSRIATHLSQLYDVRPVELDDKSGDALKDALAELDALLVVGTDKPYSDEQLKAIDAFLMEGKAAAFMLDGAKVDLKTFAPTKVDHGFDAMLEAYGVGLGGDLVADVECASLSVQERRGFMVVQMPMKYPFIPQTRNIDPEHPITRGLTDLTIPFSTPLFLDAKEGTTATALVKSSKKSWLEEATATNMNPRRDWAKAEILPTGPYDLAAAISGTLPSAFDEGKKAEKEARVLVIGNGNMLSQEFLGGQNAALVLNVVDWMLLDQGLLQMRTRGMAEPPLDPDLSDQTRLLVKWGNVIGVPLLLVLIGLFRWTRRQARRRRYLEGEV